MIARLIRERVLSVPHSMREIPPAEPSEIAVENQLFGWVLRLGKVETRCVDEAEARYLAAFARMGFCHVPVPERREVIGDVVEALERSTDELWERILEETSLELRPRRRKELITLVWDGVRRRILGGATAACDGTGGN